MRWSDIPQLTAGGDYNINVSWERIEKTLHAWSRDGYIVQTEPEFQRSHVWTVEQQSRFVEYVLRGGKSSRILHWNCPVFGRASFEPAFNHTMLLVDGLQRLTAAREFMADRVRAFGLYKTEFAGRFPWSDADFVFSVNHLGSYAQVLQWYIDLNAGGVAHTDEEINRVRALLEVQHP